MVESRLPGAITSGDSVRVDLDGDLGIQGFRVEGHLPQGVAHDLAAVVDPLLNSGVEDDLEAGGRVLEVPLGRVDVIDVLEAEALFSLFG